MITGDSGVGKSEAAIELIMRGHRLVADDAVEILSLIHIYFLKIFLAFCVSFCYDTTCACTVSYTHLWQ